MSQHLSAGVLAMEIDVSLLSPCSLQELQFGELFLPKGQGERFLRGRVNDDQVLISLDGDFDLGLVQDWDRPAGMKVSGLRFLVEIESAVPAECSVQQHGWLVKGGEGLFIISAAMERRHTFALQPGEGPTRVDRGMLAFGEWKIVTGEREDEVTLYTRG
jgi:hypothetical protein